MRDQNKPQFVPVQCALMDDDEDIENDATPISINRLSVRKNTTGDMLHESDRMAFSGRQSQFEN